MKKKKKMRIKKTGAAICFNVQPPVRDAFEAEAFRRKISNVDFFRELVAPFLGKNI